MHLQMDNVTLHCDGAEYQGQPSTAEVSNPDELMQALHNTSVSIIFVKANIALDAKAVNGTIVINNRNVSLVGGVPCFLRSQFVQQAVLMWA